MRSALRRRVGPSRDEGRRAEEQISERWLSGRTEARGAGRQTHEVRPKGEERSDESKRSPGLRQ